MAGGMGVRKNIHIENWASYRENCEHYFKFSRGNWTRLAIFGFGVPIAAYLAITSELRIRGHPVGAEGLRGQFKYLGDNPEQK